MGRNIGYTPRELYKRLEKTVIGQEYYLKKLSNTIWLHKQRLIAKSKVLNPERLPKINLFVVGPTGSGKTLAVSELAKLYGLDVGVFNTVDFTGAGWKGRDVDEIIKDLYFMCDCDIERTESAIAVLDEVDKMIIQKEHGGSASSAENSLLKLIEGMDVTLEINHKFVNVNTKNILFIAAGAFEGIEEIVQKRIGGQKKIGFTANNKEIVNVSNIYEYIAKEDLLVYGVGAQFLGRFSEFSYLNMLDTEVLSRILTESDASIVKNMSRMLLATSNIDLSIDKDAADIIAKRAIDTNAGARGLSQIVTSELFDIIFNFDECSEGYDIKITTENSGKVKVIKVPASKKSEKIAEWKMQIGCTAKRNRIENFTDYILNAASNINVYSIREIRAAHALLCSIIFYILLECPEDDHNLQSIKKILDVAISNDGEKFVYDIFMEGHEMEYNFYYDKFKYLDPKRKSIRLAQNAIEVFIRKPEFLS